jgi:cellulose synthase/poly-beta-1,6-N-acetylglucosamine synthase-like glycosyltransferase
MRIVGFGLVGFAAMLVLYAYVIYPAFLYVLSRLRGRRPLSPADTEWPQISISLPVYNEESQIAEVIESLLAIDYPAGCRQILVISDGSSDRTADIAASYADHGVELLRMPARAGKTASENAGARLLRGKIVINTDASVRIHPAAVKALIRQFADPTVGVASGRDVSVARATVDGNVGEGGYVGYEMWIRSLETAVGGIVGASGCFYAIRTDLHRVSLPEGLSRDFAAPLVAREHGFRAVSVDEALCFVPRTKSLKREYSRKVRTMTRGIETLAHKRHLLNPFRYGGFAWMLFSHKVCRWSVPWAALLGAVGLSFIALTDVWALATVGAALFVVAWGAFGWLVADRLQLPRLLAVPAFALVGNAAALHASVRALNGGRNAMWEPTRR